MATTRKVMTGCVFSILLLLIGRPVLADESDTASRQAPVSDSGGGVASLQPENWYSLQVGAYLRLPLAEKAVVLLQDKGVDSFYRYEDTGSKGMWYRVYVGRYATRMEARQVAGRLIEQEVADACILRKLSADSHRPHDLLAHGGKQPLSDVVKEKGNRIADRHTLEPHQAHSSASHAAPPVRKNHAPSRPAPEPGLETAGISGPAVVRLSLIDAIRYSLEGNREINIISYKPKQAQAQVESTESVYDAQLFAGAAMRRDPNLDSSVTDIVTEDEFSTRAGIRKPLKTGGSLSTYIETRSSDLNNAGFNRTYRQIVSPTVELKQPLLNNIGGKQEEVAIKIAKYQANISNEEFRKKVVEVTSRVTNVYWKLYLSGELVTINRKNLDMAEEVRRREAERYARGISQRLDVERAKSNEQARRSTWLRSLEEYELTMDRLKLLLNRGTLTIDSDSRVIPVERPMTAPVVVDETAVIQKALDNRPEIIKARQELMIREVDQDLAAHQLLPKLDFIGRYSITGYGNDVDAALEDVSMDDDDIWEVGLQFEWAFGNRSARSRLRKRILGRKQAIAQLRHIGDEIKLEVKEVLLRLESLQGEIASSRLAREAAQNVVEGEFTRFDIGQTGNEELLRAQDLLAETGRSFARALVDYNTAVHELEFAQGNLPEGVVIQQ